MDEEQKFVLTRAFIQKAEPNSIDLANTEEAFDNYFKLGGTVAKMTVVTAQKYHLHKQRVIEARESE